MNIRIISLIALIALSFACKDTAKDKPISAKVDKGVKTANIEMKVIDVDMETKHTLPFDSLIEFVSFVKLETTDDNLIGEASNVIFIDDKIVVVDRMISNMISVYDSTGRFLNSIGKMGQGPADYTSLWHVSKFPDKSLITVADMGTQRVKNYDLKGNVVDSYTPPFWAEGCYYIDKTDVVLFSDRGMKLSKNDETLPQIILSNLSGDVSFSGFPTERKKNFHFTTLDQIKRIGDKLLYCPSYSDTIFQIEKNGVYPYYYLNIKRDKKIEKEDKLNENVFREKLYSLSAYFRGEFLELDDYAMFNITENNDSWTRFVTYSKTNKQSYYCNGTYYDTRLRFYTDRKFVYKENMIVACVNAETLLMFKDELYRLCKKEDIDLLLKDLTEDDNPVLMYYRVKV